MTRAPWNPPQAISPNWRGIGPGASRIEPRVLHLAMPQPILPGRWLSTSTPGVAGVAVQHLMAFSIAPRREGPEFPREGEPPG